MKKTCVECGEEFHGRSDKVYCSSECRSARHNRQNSDVTNLMRNVNNALRKNRRILAALNPAGKGKVHREKMAKKGFNFNYFTNVYRAKNGNVYYFCYDQGYRKIEGDYMVLVQRQAYVE